MDKTIPTRHDWTLEEVQKIYDTPLMELILNAATLHKTVHRIGKIQLCSLISIKTGGCPEDCKYCSQSSFYNTDVKATPLMKYESVLKEAREAIAKGATRICLGAALRGPRNSPQFEEILKMVRAITDLGVEVCCTLGTLDKGQAQKLKEAGLFAYNHNLDTSKEFYPSIISTRTYEERMGTLDVVEEENISLCCGGILGMGETIKDRLKLLITLANRKKHPGSVPINRLIPINGTPLEGRAPITSFEMVRIIAVARMMMPNSMLRLSAGRLDLSWEAQALAFLAGANSIFMGEKLLTAQNNSPDSDQTMMDVLGLNR